MTEPRKRRPKAEIKLQNENGLSWCPTCEQYKPFDQFRASARKNGCQGYCKPCTAAYMTRRRAS